jgi:FtsP/CotA-like multicopper oxidase with cupredoxin domain
VPYGDSMMTNMTLRAQYTVPSQVVRFRILNGGMERSYNLGFSDGRSFQVIASDGGLLTAPVTVTRYLLHLGERIEILVDCSSDIGKSIDLKAYNSTLAQNVAGGDFFPNGPFANFLARKDFDILHINVGAKTSNPITTIPTTLRTVTTIPASDAKITRSLTITDTNIVGNNGVSFLINHKLFDINYNNYDLPLNNTEIWEITSTSNFGHPFHIHDVEFNILSSGGVAPVAAQAGWKDVVFVPARSTVKFIAKFDDYADPLHPFMYHCHIALHEDEGMMGQFIVTDKTNSINSINQSDFSLYPNPANNKLYFSFNKQESKVYYVSILNIVGKAVMMLPRPEWQNGIDISNLNAGTYFVQLTDDETKTTTVKKFVKE